MAVKGNQGTLEQAVLDTVRFEKLDAINIEDDCGYGRIEKRTCRVYSELGHIENKENWKKLKTIVTIESEVFNKTSGESTTELRYYISSIPQNAEFLNASIRNHWSVENNLHWTMDVEFGEDKSRKRAGYAAENNNIVLKMAMTLLANDNSKKVSKRAQRLRAALDTKYRDKLLNF